MKRTIIIAVSAILLSTQLHSINAPETSPEPQSEVFAVQKAETPNKKKKAPVKLTEAQKRSKLVKQNPNDCNMATHWIVYPSGRCEPKQKAQPQQKPPVQRTVATGSGDCSLVNKYDWPTNVAYQICQHESGGNPNATNWGDDHSSWAGCMGSFGLMQINCSHGQVYNGEKNMQIAYSMWKGWGNSFAAWTSCAKVPGCY